MRATCHARPASAAAPRASPRRFSRASRRGATRVPRATSSTPTDDAADKRKNPALYDGSLHTAAADDASRIAPASRARAAARKPEILAPAGGWPQMRAAVEAGADAVYFGLNLLNARARAANFDVEELPDVVAFLHERGVRGFVTMNVLVFDEELAQAEALVRAVAKAGVDAVIVQDVGLVELVRRVAPNLAIHGSTQMSITSPEGAEFARELGCKRVVVGRELSVREIAAVRDGTDAEVEAFVHGALCVSYSGQCFSSEAWGGRSANRGQCAQACRLPYGLVVDGDVRDMGDVKYLLSPQDLMAVEMVPSLVEAGVSCFKIEGRLKGPEYVALTTSVYRRALDDAWAARLTREEASDASHGTSSSASVPEWTLPASDRVDLAQVFARGQDADHDGLTRGFLEGPAHQRLVRGRAPRHRGVLLGQVTESHVRRGGGVVVRLTGAAALKRGDGVVFDRGAPDEPEAGGNVWEVLDASGRSVGKGVDAAVREGEYELTFDGAVARSWGSSDGPAEPRRGDLVWRTGDADLDARLRRMIPEGAVGEAPATRRDAVTVRVSSVGVGAPLRVTIVDARGREGVAETDAPLAPAEKQPMSFASIAKAIGQLGGTPFEVGELNVDGVDLDAGVFVPAGEIKSCRRRAVEALTTARRNSGAATAEGMPADPVAAALVEAAWWGERVVSKDDGANEDGSSSGSGSANSGSRSSKPSLSVLCRTREQAEAALEVDWLDEIVLDFLEVHGLQAAVDAVRASGRSAVVATPRVLKPDEERLWRFYLKLGADALLVRSAGLMQTLTRLRAEDEASGAPARVPPLRGDFSLNAANAVGAAAFSRAWGLERLTPTHDLNARQQAALAKALGPEGAAALEVVIHQHLPIFHTEHCVFCRFLSDGNSYKDCGHPCETTDVHLRDGEGKDHLVLADMGCRNTVFNAQAQSGAEYAAELVAAGVRRFRVELVDEPGSVVAPLMDAYRQVLAGERRGADVVEWVGSLPDANGRSHGAGRGSLEVRKERDRGTMKQTAAAKNAAARMAAKGR
jgi:putative protease